MLRMSRFAAPCSHPHPSRWGIPAGLNNHVASPLLTLLELRVLTVLAMACVCSSVVRSGGAPAYPAPFWRLPCLLPMTSLEVTLLQLQQAVILNSFFCFCFLSRPTLVAHKTPMPCLSGQLATSVVPSRIRQPVDCRRA